MQQKVVLIQLSSDSRNRQLCDMPWTFFPYLVQGDLTLVVQSFLILQCLKNLFCHLNTFLSKLTYFGWVSRGRWICSGETVPSWLENRRSWEIQNFLLAFSPNSLTSFLFVFVVIAVRSDTLHHCQFPPVKKSLMSVLLQHAVSSIFEGVWTLQKLKNKGNRLIARYYPFLWFPPSFVHIPVKETLSHSVNNICCDFHFCKIRLTANMDFFGWQIWRNHWYGQTQSGVFHFSAPGHKSHSQCFRKLFYFVVALPQLGLRAFMDLLVLETLERRKRESISLSIFHS